MEKKYEDMFLVRHSKLVLVCLSFLLLFSVLFIPRIRAVFNFRDFLIKNDPDLEFYEKFEREFDFENEILLVGVYHEPSVFNSNFLNQLKTFTQACGDLLLVDRAYSLATLNEVINSPFGPISIPYVHIDDPWKYASDSAKINNDERLVGWMISKDFKTATVVLNTQKNLDEVAQRKLIASLDSLIAFSSFSEVHIAGTRNTEIRHVRMIGHELLVNTILCSLIMIMSLIIIFRSTVGVIIPAVTVLSSMLIFFGWIGIFHQNFNLLSTLFPTIILIVGVSDIIHFLTKYQYFLGGKMDRNKAIRVSFSELLLPMFITSLTTAIGFFSLITAPIQPIQSFGIESGIGVMLTFLLTVLFVPAILSNIKPQRFNLNMRYQKNWQFVWQKIDHFTDLRGNMVIGISVVLIFISFFGIIKINTNNRVIDNFPAKSEIRQDFLFFEQHLSGVRSLKLAVLPSEERMINDPKVLQEIEKVHNYLKTFPETGVVFSPATLYKTMNKAYHRGMAGEYRLPTSQVEIDKLDKFFRSYRSQQFRLINEDETAGVITAQILDIGSQKMNEMNARIERWIAENIDPEIVRFRETGISFLSDKSNNSLRRNIMISLLFAFMMVSLLMALLFKHINLLVISLLPNILPLAVAGGVMGFTGLVFNASTAVVFTIGFVIAVDNTIHFLSRFRVELRASSDVGEAVRLTFHKTGKAIILTSVILLLGFFALFRSELKGVFAQGVLFSSIIISASFGDLLLLPVLLRVFLKNTKY